MENNNVLEISAYLIQLGSQEEKLLTNISLQKILYFAQGFHLALRESKLFSEKIYAWEYGPVVREVYHIYKGFGNKLIYPKDNVTIPELHASVETKDLVLDVWNLFKGYTPFELVSMTHANGSPWHEIYAAYNGCIPYDIEIDTDKMKSYFKTLLA